MKTQKYNKKAPKRAKKTTKRPKKEQNNTKIPNKAPKNTVYIISCAQNNTEVHPNLLSNILKYKEHIEKEGYNVKIYIIPVRYKNPTSIYFSQEEDVWDDRITEYLLKDTKKISSFVILGSVKIQPTAINPLNNIYQLGKGDNVIVGHPKQHLLTFNNGRDTKIAISTGMVTKQNYTDTKSGKRGEFNHQFGFVILNYKSEGEFPIRYVTADNSGNFIDIDVKLENSNTHKGRYIEGVVLGDVHYTKEDKDKYTKSVEFIKKHHIPRVVLHDIFDGYTISPFRVKNQLEVYINKNKRFTLMDELGYVRDSILKLQNETQAIIYVVKSNHDEFLDRWLANKINDFDINELYTYAELIYIMLKNKKVTDVFATWFEHTNSQSPNIKFLTRNDTLIIKEWLVSLHGDIGLSGRKASINTLKQIASKVIVGHHHTAHRFNNVAAVGTLEDKSKATYLKGLNKWTYTNVIILSNGKIQHLFV